jgi:mannose/fructose-specific phosphotransferase system component IIA
MDLNIQIFATTSANISIIAFDPREFIIPTDIISPSPKRHWNKTASNHPKCPIITPSLSHYQYNIPPN